MNTLKYCSTQEGYSVAFQSGVVSQELDGGAPRNRRLSKIVFTLLVFNGRYLKLDFNILMRSITFGLRLLVKDLMLHFG